MAFTPDTLVQASLSQDATTPTVYAYRSTADAVATIVAANYFALTAAQVAAGYTQRMKVGDTVYLNGTNGTGQRWVNAVTGTSAITVAALS